MKRIRIGRRFVQLVVRGREVEELDSELLKKIARCYREVFNESWGEKWTLGSAEAEILKSFRSENGREFIGTILLQGEEVIGFSWGVLADISCVSAERDFPFHSPLPEKQTALKALLRWLEVSRAGDKVLIFREIGALKSVRGRLAGHLAFHLFRAGLEGGASKMFLWTSPNSAAFRLGLGLLWRPIFFFENGCLIMAGGLHYAYSLAKRGLSFNPLRAWLAYRELRRNVKNFF